MAEPTPLSNDIDAIRTAIAALHSSVESGEPCSDQMHAAYMAGVAAVNRMALAERATGNPEDLRCVPCIDPHNHGTVTFHRATGNPEGIDALRAENDRLREGIRILQENWPKTVPAPMDARQPKGER